MRERELEREGGGEESESKLKIMFNTSHTNHVHPLTMISYN